MINFNKYLEEVNEGKIVLKRKYTEKHPEKNVRQGANIRNSIIEALRDKKLTLSEFNEIVAKHSKSPNKWTQRNKRFFKIEEDSITLSKYGSKILSSLEPINEAIKSFEVDIDGDYEEIDIAEIQAKSKQGDYINIQEVIDEILSDRGYYSDDYEDAYILGDRKKIIKAITKQTGLKESVNEGTYADYGLSRKFSTALDNLPSKKFNDKDITALAKKHKQDIEAALKYAKAAFGWLWNESVDEKSFDKMISKSKYDYDNLPSSLDLPDDEPNLDEPAEMKNIKKFQKKYGTGIKVTTDNKVIGKRVTVYMEPGIADGPDEVMEPQLKRHEEMMDFVKKHDLKISIADTVKGEWIFWTRYGVQESVVNEAIAIEGKRDAKKVVTQLTRIFKRLSDTQQMGKSGILGCIKYLCGEAMTDANFHREQPFVMKAIKGASIPGVQIKLPGLGGYYAKISSGRIKEILDKYVADISSAAGWGGQGIVEGCALYIATILKDEATATAMINAFNSQFEGENIRVNIEDKLNENKNTDMLHTNFTDFLNESYINEALKSSKLRNLIDMKKSPKTLLKGIYGAFKIALDKVEDHQILDIDPKDGPKQTDSIVLYYTTQEKENPYATDSYYNAKFPANTLLALARGKKVFYVKSDWSKGRGNTYSLTTDPKGGFGRYSGATDIGPNKSYSGYDASGLGSLARVIEVADAAIAINPESLESTEDKIRDRARAKEGALAFKSDKEFKAANMQRYNDILAKRASSLDIDKLVEDAIVDMANIMKDAIKNKEKNKYGELIAGVGADGRAYKMNDISNFTSNLLRDYERWAGYIADIEKAKERYKDDAKELQWEVKYAEKEAKEYAKAIKDRLAKLKKRNLAW